MKLDYDRAKKQSYWTVHEAAVYLSIDEDLIRRALSANDLKYLDNSVTARMNEHLRPSEVIAWAIEVGFPVNDEFRSHKDDSPLSQKIPLNPLRQNCPANAPCIGFYCENVTSWADVEMKIVNDYMMEIHAGGQVYNKEYCEIGLSGRGRGPSLKWSLLKELANNNGMLQTGSLSHDERHNLKKRISQIRDYLKKIFPNIKEDPFDPCSKVNGYRTRFKLYSKESQ